MFYAHFVLAKKGPLARIWLAAHWDKKLTKAHVFETNIETSVEGILQPKVKMALRTSGHLLLGIVRIYSRKAKYLLADCNEAFIKIKMAFRPGAVDLPEENRQAALNTITLPEVFHDFEAGMPDLNNIDMEAAVTLNQSRAEDITLKEDYGSLSLLNDDGFGDMGFDDPEMAREATNIDEAFDQASLLLGGGSSVVPRPSDQRSATQVSEAGADASALGPMAPSGNNLDAEGHNRDDPFGAQGSVGDMPGEDNLLEGDHGNLFEPAGLFDDAPLGHVPLDASGSDRDGGGPLVTDNDQQPGPAPGPTAAAEESDDDDDMYDMGPPSMGAPSGPSSPESSVGVPEAPEMEGGQGPPQALPGMAEPAQNGAMPPPVVQPLPQAPEAPAGTADGMVAPADQTTLINNEDESFALAPLDSTVVQGVEKAKTKRKRKLIVDEVKNISGEEMKSQLSDTSDIITTLDLAPPTKRLMHWKETGGVEKLFALPGRPILSKALSRLYQRHLTTKAMENENFGGEEDHLLLEEEEAAEQMRLAEEESNSLALHAKRRRLEEELVQPQPTPQGPPSFDMGQQDYGHGGHMVQGADPYASPLPMPPMVPPPEYGHQQSQMQSPMQAQMQQHMQSPMQQQMQQQMQPQMQLQDGWPQSDYGYPGSVPANQVPDYQHPYQLGPPTPQGVMMGHPMTPLHQHHQEEDHHQNALFPPLHSEPLMEYPSHPQPPTTAPPSPPPIMAPPTPMAPPIPMAPPTSMAPPSLPHHMTEEPSHPPSEFDALVAAASGSALHGYEEAPQPTQAEAETEAEHLPELQTDLAEEALAAQQQQQQQQQQQEQQEQQEQQAAQQMDDDDDYGAPSSVGPPDEQLADETYEQFEERILNKRTVHMLHMIRHPLESGRRVMFSDLTRNCNRKQVAQKFYTFLVLKKQQAVELSQDGPYAELYIERGPKFEQSL
ncbi:unnamed protein product [Ixodes hexagonus]